MKCDVIVAGVGGQGVLSVAAIIAKAAVDEKLTVRQSEVNGMAQRGGAVSAHLRIADNSIASDLIPRGGANLILSMEPLESLRYAAWLAPKPDNGGPANDGIAGGGALVTAAEPFVNIPNYPEISGVIKTIESFPLFRIVEAAALAKEAGLAKSVNMVMVGAASAFLPIRAETIEETIKKMFGHKEVSIVEANIKAFYLGRSAAK